MEQKNEKGMELKQKLATKNVYVATLWPNVIEMEGTLETMDHRPSPQEADPSHLSQAPSQRCPSC